MAKYVLFFSYTPDAWNRMIKNPGDRVAAARAGLETIGATLERFTAANSAGVGGRGESTARLSTSTSG
jgi:uncharacterized protein with GYD domain